MPFLAPLPSFFSVKGQCRAASVAVLGLLAVATPLAAQDISADRIADGIRTISSDAYGGRLPGTVGERMTLAWLQAQYEAMGLQPGGPEGEWLQPVDLERYAPVSATASWTGPDGLSHHLTPGTDIVVRSAANDGQARIVDAPLVFAGYGIHAPERGWDDYGDLDLAGKIVILVAGEPNGDLFNGPYATVYDTNFHKEAEAFRRGALGVLTLVPAAVGDPAWSAALRSGGAQRTFVPGVHDMEVQGSVPHDVAAAWAQAAGVQSPAILASLASGDFRAFDLNGVRLSVEVTETRTVQRTYNLLARIPGAERPDETILYSAHWDHVGTSATPDVDGDSVFNGAWDNASGTVGVVEVARALAAAPRPERSIVFAHMTAEEQGLLGAFWYAANPVWPLETTVADINIDMLPLSAPTRDIAIFGYGQTTLEDDLQALATAEGRYVTDDREPEQNYFYRSDHFPYALKGVPALMPWHGVDLDEGGVEVGLPAYRALFGERYHRRSDEWDAAYDLSSAVENLTLLYRLGLDLANSDRWPGWKDGSEFAAVRAASDKARD